MISQTRTAEVETTVAVTRPGARAVLPNYVRASGYFCFRSSQSVASTFVESIMAYSFSRGIRASQLMEKMEPQGFRGFTEIEIAPLALTRAQQVALLTLRYSDHGQQVLDALFANGQPRSTPADRESLVPLGLAARDRQGYHGITPMGQWRARIVAREVAAEIGVMLVDHRRLQRRGLSRLYGMSDAGNG